MPHGHNNTITYDVCVSKPELQFGCHSSVFLSKRLVTRIVTMNCPTADHMNMELVYYKVMTCSYSGLVVPVHGPLQSSLPALKSTSVLPSLIPVCFIPSGKKMLVSGLYLLELLFVPPVACS